MATANANTVGASFATPEEVAEAGLTAFEKGKDYLLRGRANYLVSLLPRILSRATITNIVAGMFKNKVRRLSSVVAAKAL
jgi:uncharacterized protein